MRAGTRRASLARLVLLTLAASSPAAATGRPGFILFKGIAGDGGDAEHQGWFKSDYIDVGGGAGIPSMGGPGSFWLAGQGPGFDALVRACLSHQSVPSAEVAFGKVRYVLEGVALDGIHVYGAGAATGGASAGKGPIVVSFRFQSLHEASAPSGRAGTGANLNVAPRLLVPTPTTARPR